MTNDQMSNEMTDTVEVESGAQLIARISSEHRPTLENLCKDVFPDDGPLAEQIIEITGECNTGKTHFLMEIMARCILPKPYGGRNAHVVFFNLDHSFRIKRFVMILEKIALGANPSSDEQKTKEVIESCLNNLLVHYCFKPEEYEMAQIHVEKLLTTDPQIALLAVDSISAFYWIDCNDKMPLKMETHLKRSIESLRKMCQEYKVTGAFTRPIFFATGMNRPLKNDSSSPNYRIHLISHDLEGVRGFEAETETRDKTYNTLYTVDNFGIRFLNL